MEENHFRSKPVFELHMGIQIEKSGGQLEVGIINIP